MKVEVQKHSQSKCSTSDDNMNSSSPYLPHPSSRLTLVSILSRSPCLHTHSHTNLDQVQRVVRWGLVHTTTFHPAGPTAMLDYYYTDRRKVYWITEYCMFPVRNSSK